MTEERSGEWDPAPGVRVKWNVKTTVRTTPAAEPAQGTRDGVPNVSPSDPDPPSLSATRPGPPGSPPLPVSAARAMRVPLFIGGTLLLLGLVAVVGGAAFSGWSFAVLGAMLLLGAGYVGLPHASASRTSGARARHPGKG